MKKTLIISKEEKNRILEMHKKAYQNYYLNEDETKTENQTTYTEEEFKEFQKVMNVKINEVLTNKKDDEISKMKIMGQFDGEAHEVFVLWSPSNENIKIPLYKGSTGSLNIADTFLGTISANKKRLVGSIDISSDIPSIISGLTDRQKEILDMDLPFVEGYTSRQLLQDYKPSLALQGLENTEADIYAEIVTTNGNPYPAPACGSWPKYDMGTAFTITELIKVEPDANTKTLRVCYGGLRLNNSSTYITTYPVPFNQMLKAKKDSLG